MIHKVRSSQGSQLTDIKNSTEKKSNTNPLGNMSRNRVSSTKSDLDEPATISQVINLTKTTLQNSESQLKTELLNNNINASAGLANGKSVNSNHRRHSNQLFDIKLNAFLSPGKSLNSLNNLPKNDETSRSSSSSIISSNSADSLNHCTNFNQSDHLSLLGPSQTSTPILVRNQTSKKAANPVSLRYDMNSDIFENNQNNLRKKQKQSPSEQLDESVTSGLKMQDSLSMNSRYQSTQASPISANSLNSSFSSVTSLIVNPNSGTIRGNFNHVRTSVKQLFERESHITNPVLNPQLNSVSINSLHQSSNYDRVNDTIDTSYDYDKNNESTVPRKLSEKNQAYQFLARDYEIEEHQKIVIYTTTLQILRLSYEKSKRVKKILQNCCVRYEEKDLYKHKKYQKELKYRLNLETIDVPHIFFNGRLIANCDQLELYSDQGLLTKLFKDVERIKLRIYCTKCGGYRYVLCTMCNGSKKKFNNFANLKCTNCSEDGLIRCDECLDQQD